MTEFAIVMPVLFMLILGLLDGCMVMFSVGTVRYATVQGAQLASQLGNAVTADDQSIRAIRDRVGTTGIFSVDEVDIYKVNQDGSGNLVADPILFNRYAIDGSPMMPEPWPAACPRKWPPRRIRDTRPRSRGNPSPRGWPIRRATTGRSRANY